MAFVLMEVGHWPGAGEPGKVVSVTVRVMVGDGEGGTEVGEGPAHWVLRGDTIGDVREALVEDVGNVRPRRDGRRVFPLFEWADGADGADGEGWEDE